MNDQKGAKGMFLDLATKSRDELLSMIRGKHGELPIMLALGDEENADTPRVASATATDHELRTYIYYKAAGLIDRVNARKGTED